MKFLLYSRRTFIGTLAILALLVIALVNKSDVSTAIAGIAAAAFASNAYEGSKTNAPVAPTPDDASGDGK